MVLKSFEDRLAIWKRLRDDLTAQPNPIQSVIDFWNNLPQSPRNIDPYDESTWPSPWEIIEENVYCEYTKILGIGYTLMLSEKFKNWHYEVQVGVDRTQSKLYYMLIADNQVIGLDQQKSVHILNISENIHIEKKYVLSEQY